MSEDRAAIGWRGLRIRSSSRAIDRSRFLAMNGAIRETIPLATTPVVPVRGQDVALEYANPTLGRV